MKCIAIHISTWWRHQMETFSALLAICARNSPYKGQWHGALMFSLICVWINGWVNNGEAGDLRRHRTHYDVRVMICNNLENNPWNKISNDSSFFKSSCILLGFVCIRTLPGFIRHGSDSMNDLIASMRNSAIFQWRLCGGRYARLFSVVPVPAWAAAMLCLGAFTSVGIRPAFLTSDQPAPYNENQLTMNLPPPFSPIFCVIMPHSLPGCRYWFMSHTTDIIMKEIIWFCLVWVQMGNGRPLCVAAFHIARLCLLSVQIVTNYHTWVFYFN